MTEDGRSLRILNVVDEYTRRCLGCRVARSIGARDILDELDTYLAVVEGALGEEISELTATCDLQAMVRSGL